MVQSKRPRVSHSILLQNALLDSTLLLESITVAELRKAIEKAGGDLSNSDNKLEGYIASVVRQRAAIRDEIRRNILSNAVKWQTKAEASQVSSDDEDAEPANIRPASRPSILPEIKPSLSREEVLEVLNSHLATTMEEIGELQTDIAKSTSALQRRANDIKSISLPSKTQVAEGQRLVDDTAALIEHYHLRRMNHRLRHPTTMSQMSLTLPLHARNHVHPQISTLHAILYSKETTTAELFEYIANHYERDATYTSPLVSLQDRNDIARQFAPLAALPGDLYSEIDEIWQNDGYAGHTSYLFSHILHYSAFPQDVSSFSNSVSAYSTYPNTPYSARTPTTRESPKMAQSRWKKSFERRPWPFERVLSYFSPRSILRTLTTFHIRVHTRITFNEFGKVCYHEDIYGLRELVEGVAPCLEHVYHIQRRALGAAVSSLASLFISPDSLKRSQAQEGKLSTDSDMADEESEVDMQIPLSRWNKSGSRGLGLVNA